MTAPAYIPRTPPPVWWAKHYRLVGDSLFAAYLALNPPTGTLISPYDVLILATGRIHSEER